MNAWIESRLCKRKGAALPLLGAFTWESKVTDDGRVFSRPIFVMSESFVKDNRVRRQRVHTQPNVIKAEEINYSKLAIKFSKNLTKNMLFSGTSDILKKIGDYTRNGREYEVAFSFGTLKCKEKKVRFEFNQGRLAAILPENLRVGTLPQETQTGLSEQDYETDAEPQLSARPESQNQMSSRLNSAASAPGGGGWGGGNTLQIPKLPLKGGSTLPPISNAQEDRTVSFSGANSGRGVGDGSATGGTEATAFFESENEKVNALTAAGVGGTSSGSTAYVPLADRPLSPRLLEIMQEMDAALHAPQMNKEELRNRAKQRVDEQAYLRSLQALESEAKDEEKIALEADALIEDFEISTREKVDDFHKKTKTINGWLTSQMQENKKVMNAELEAKKKFQGSFFLPENAGNVLMPSGSLPGGQHKAAIKDGLRKDLKYQIRNNATKKGMEKARQETEEREYLDHIAMEMDLEAIEVRAKHLQTQKILLESWERDAHVRNLKKLQMGGIGAVREYVSINLPEAHDASTGKIKQSMGFSVGYDTRSGKATK